MDVWAASSQQDMEEPGVQPPVSTIGMYDKKKQVNQYLLFQELNRLLLDCHRDPIKVLLERAAEVGMKVFRFQRATVSLLNEKKAVYEEWVRFGYGEAMPNHSGNGAIPRETIDDLFSDRRFQVKMVYRENRATTYASRLDREKTEKRTLDRRRSDQWRDGDHVIIRLKKTKNETFGYIQFEMPENDHIGGRDLFHNLELFGQWTSFAIVQHGQVFLLRKRAKRLKQLFVTSNAFKLHYNLAELFDEICWGIKNASEFRLVAGGLFDGKGGDLKMKAVACDDKIIKNRILEIQFPKKALIEIFRKDEYKKSKSYLVQRQERVFRSFKQVYYGSTLSEEKKEGKWPDWGLLILPIHNRDNRMIGFLMADDPSDSQLPGNEDIEVLETMSNQFGIAIENRILYRKMQQRAGDIDIIEIEETPDFQDDPTLYISSRMKKRNARKQ